MDNGYFRRIERAKAALDNAEYVVIGAGAGLSDAAGIKYSGARFTDNFKPFIEKYGFTDLYTSSFYPFKTEEQRWAYWAKHISINRFEIPAMPLYGDLLTLVNGKDYFVITTNVESQFYKSGFSPEKIFAVQGDYGYLQCANACHKKLYYNEKLVADMLEQTVDCAIPSSLVPHCPVCGAKMEVNLRKDGMFVEDEKWKEAGSAYEKFINNAVKGKLLLLELGVGFNTPGIIRYPFEKIVYMSDNTVLVRINAQHALGAEENVAKTISFDEDMSVIINDLLAM